MTTIGAIDIGGSGCRAARVVVGPNGRLEVGDLHRLSGIVRRADLAARMTEALGRVDMVGIAVPGMVDRAAGAVDACRAAPWVEGPPGLGARMGEELGLPVAVVHDGEAHLIAHLDRHEHPMLCLSLGTAVGFAASDERGRVRRPRDGSSWDIGMVRLPTRASNPELWWALGSPGLREVITQDGSTDGPARYAMRLAGALRDLAVVFQPRSIVLTGGIVAGQGAAITPVVDRELHSQWAGPVAPPVVVGSPFPQASALVGAALAVARGAGA